MLTDHDLRLGAYLDEWLDRHRAHVRPVTHESYRQVVRAYLRPHLGDRRLADLDIGQVRPAGMTVADGVVRLLGTKISWPRTVVIAPSLVDAPVHDAVAALDHLLWGHRTAPTAASPTSETGEAAA